MGNALGYWAATDTGQTGILAGSLLGTYDPVGPGTFNSVAMGAYLETNLFLTMAGKIGSSPNIAALERIEHPGGGDWSHDAQRHQRFEQCDDSGRDILCLRDGPEAAALGERQRERHLTSSTGPINMSSTSGLGLYATFNMQSWSAGSPWWATIDNGGGSGLVFKGFAAGSSNAGLDLQRDCGGCGGPDQSIFICRIPRRCYRYGHLLP